MNCSSWVIPLCTFSSLVTPFNSGHHRVHIFLEMKQGWCVCPLSWSVHCNFTGDSKCNERGWACTPHPHQPGPILPSSQNVRQKAAVATLCTLWRPLYKISGVPICIQWPISLLCDWSIGRLSLCPCQGILVRQTQCRGPKQLSKLVSIIRQQLKKLLNALQTN
jgi:hypothetical protein